MISREQFQQAESGQPVNIRFDQTEFVLIRKDVYESVKTLLDLSIEETYEAVEEAWGEETDAYQDFK